MTEHSFSTSKTLFQIEQLVMIFKEAKPPLCVFEDIVIWMVGPIILSPGLTLKY